MPANDEFGYHEVMDRASILQDSWDINISQHEMLEEQSELKKMSDEIAEKMADFYQAAYVASSIKFRNTKKDVDE